VFSESLWEVLTVELGIEFLIEVDTMCGDFEGINGSGLVDIVEGIVIEELA